MNYSEIIDKVSKELELPPDLVDKVYRAYWTSIRKTIEELPLKEDLDEDAFSKLKPNFNIPSLGKLCVTWDRYIGSKQRLQYIKQLKNKNDKAEED